MRLTPADARRADQGFDFRNRQVARPQDDIVTGDQAQNFMHAGDDIPAFIQDGDPLPRQALDLHVMRRRDRGHPDFPGAGCERRFDHGRVQTARLGIHHQRTKDAHPGAGSFGCSGEFDRRCPMRLEQHRPPAALDSVLNYSQRIKILGFSPRGGMYVQIDGSVKLAAHFHQAPVWFLIRG